MKTELCHETTLKNSAFHHKGVHWLHHRCFMDEHNVYSVTSEASPHLCEIHLSDVQ